MNPIKYARSLVKSFKRFYGDKWNTSIVFSDKYEAEEFFNWLKENDFTLANKVEYHNLEYIVTYIY